MPVDPDRYRPLPLPPLHRRVIGCASRWVPRLRRASWRREWEAELAYAWSRTAADENRGRRRLLLRAIWSYVDALWVWKEEMTMTRLMTDSKLALRSLRRSPMFTAVAIFTLALGIGANTAIFSVVNGVLLKPLPYPESENLVFVLFEAPGIGYPQIPFSDGTYVFIRDNQRAFDSLGMFNEETVNLVGDGDPERVAGTRITPSVFEALRIRPTIGRLFNEGDTVPGAEPVTLLSYELWQSRYAADEGIVGEMAEFDGLSRRIVGVLPEGFAFPDVDTRVYRPFELDEADLDVGSFSSPGIARLADGVTIEAAMSDLSGLVARFPEQFPDALPQQVMDQARFAPVVTGLKELIVGDIQRALWVVLGTVGAVLLIACANVANLFLVRAEIRQREVTLRSALGAGRGDVIRFYLTESLVLSLAGGLLGLGLAFTAIRFFKASAPAAIPRTAEIGIDPAVLGFTLSVSLLAGVLFGIVPLLRRGTANLATQLREGGRSTTAGGRVLNTRNLLVVAQVALALVLLVGSGLMIRSFRALRNVDPGFVADDILTVAVALPSAEYPDTEHLDTFWNELVERVASLPGVESVSAISGMPLGGGKNAGSVQMEDYPTEDNEIGALASHRSVLPGYFATMGIPVLEGRELQTTDGADGHLAVVVNSGFAQHWWPEGSALGKRVTRWEIDEDTPAWYEIVGVVGDVHFEGLQIDPEEIIYYPIPFGAPAETDAPGYMDLIIRSAGNPSALATVVRQAVWEVDPRLPIANIRPMSRVLADSVSRTSFTLAMLGIAAGVALLLGAIGIYGVISYLVSQRTQEIGVRIALGAPAATVRRMVVRRGMGLTLVGIMVGLAAALGVSSVLAALLYEVSATDPITYVGVTVILAATALLACWLPALRASSVDPMVALRSE